MIRVESREPRSRDGLMTARARDSSSWPLGSRLAAMGSPETEERREEDFPVLNSSFSCFGFQSKTTCNRFQFSSSPCFDFSQKRTKTANQTHFGIFPKSKTQNSFQNIKPNSFGTDYDVFFP
ncbi:hypothetical protein Droror1_Dr00026022 [Drosera rotundifolia]